MVLEQEEAAWSQGGYGNGQSKHFKKFPFSLADFIVSLTTVRKPLRLGGRPASQQDVLRSLGINKAVMKTFSSIGFLIAHVRVWIKRET